MDTSFSPGEVYDTSPIFCANQDEALNKDGHQNWHRLVLHDFNNGEQFEAVIHKYETWSQPSDKPEIEFRGVRGEGDIERNRERATRKAKKKIRHAGKSARFDRMLTLTTGEAKRGSLHAHVAVRGRQDYKLLQSVWNYRICGGRGYVRVRNGSRKMNSSSIASYISKYISKSISDVALNKKSCWISHNIAAPVRTVNLFRTVAEALVLANGILRLQGCFLGL